MRTARAKLEKLTNEAIGRRLGETVDPLARARIKSRLGMNTDALTDAELYALAEDMAPGSVARAQQAPEAQAQRQRLANMSAAELLAELARISRPGDRLHDPEAFDRRWANARMLAEREL